MGTGAGSNLFGLDTYQWTEDALKMKTKGEGVSTSNGSGIMVIIKPTADQGHIVRFTASGDAADAATQDKSCWEKMCNPCDTCCDGTGVGSSANNKKALTVIFSTKDINYIEMIDTTTMEQLSIGVLKCCCCKSEELYDDIKQKRKMLLHMHYGQDVLIPFEQDLTETPTTQRDCWCWCFGSNPGVDRSHSQDTMVHGDGTEISWQQTLEKHVPSHSTVCYSKVCCCCCPAGKEEEKYTTTRVKYSMDAKFMDTCHEEGATFSSLANILMLLAVADRDAPGASVRNAGLPGPGQLKM